MIATTLTVIVAAAIYLALGFMRFTGFRIGSIL
jgi:hypothetical protein